MKSTIARTLSETMAVLWDSDEAEPVFVALASYVKTHNKHNPENVFDVIGILFSQSLVSIQPFGGERNSSERNFMVDVKFADGSRCFVEMVDGIGSSCEPVEEEPAPANDDEPTGDSTLSQD